MVTLKLLYPVCTLPHSALTDGSLSSHFTCTWPAQTHITFCRRGNPTLRASPAPEWLSDLYGPTLSSSQLLDSLLSFICIFCPTSQDPFLLCFPPPHQNQLRTLSALPFPHLLPLMEKSRVASLTQFLIFLPKRQENPYGWILGEVPHPGLRTFPVVFPSS